jgi:hypothetical protein
MYRARGVDMVGEIVQQPWGMREFAIRDCNGYVFAFRYAGLAEWSVARGVV